MKREQFKQELIILSDFEKHLRVLGGVDNLFASEFPTIYEKDDDGYYRLTREKLLASRELTRQNKLHNPMEHSYFQDRLRLLVHSRFSTIPFHSNEFISINYVYQGQLEVTFPNQKVTLTEGQILFMNTNVIHSMKIAGEDDLIFSFQIEKEFLSTELLIGLSGDNPIVDFLVKTMMGQDTDFTYLVGTYDEDDRMKLLLEDIFCEYLDSGVYSQQLIENYIKNFFIYLLRSKTEEVKLHTKADIVSIISEIETNYINCSLESLAEIYHFSPKYLSRLIKEKTNHSFTELLIDARLRAICYYLKNSEASIQDIAIQCGYSNQNHFYKKFQEKYDMTPKEYREGAKE